MSASIRYIVTYRSSILRRVVVEAATGAEAMQDARRSLENGEPMIEIADESEQLPPEVTEARPA